MKIEVVTKRGWFRTRWFWRIVGVNGETLCHSENYASHQKAQQAAREVARVASASGFQVYEVKE